jgi:hypothetical protein
MDTLVLRNLNELLGRELGRIGDRPIFSWKHSDGLFWPAFKTGETTREKREFDVPLIGRGYHGPTSAKSDLGMGDATVTCVEEIVVPVYRKDRQVRNSAWYMTKLLTAEALIWGWIGKHGDPTPEGRAPRIEQLMEIWNSRFPGADFPAKGWRVPTDAYLPRFIGGPREPNLLDTEDFIKCIREQTSLSFALRLQDMTAYEVRKEADTRRDIEDAVRDSFPAFLNPVPGKRSNFVSFPWSGKDRVS